MGELTWLDPAWNWFWEHAPPVLTGLGVLLALWLVALALRAVTRRVLGLTKLDEVVGSSRVGKLLTALSQGMTPSRALAQLVYLALLLFALMTAADVAGLRAMQEILSQVLGYIPQIISAVLIIAAGGYLAGLVSGAIDTVLREMRSPYAKMLASIAEGALLVVVFAIAVDTLGVDLTFITSNITLLVAAVVATLCFLFAWSMRRPAEDIIANYYLRRLVNKGDRIVLHDVEGVVESFAPIGVVLRTDAQELEFVPARHVLDGVSTKGRPRRQPQP